MWLTVYFCWTALGAITLHRPPSASHPPHKGQGFTFRLSISRLQSTYTCTYWASPHRCSPTKRESVLGVATGAYSVLGAWPGLGSEGWHGWRCEYLRGHTQRHMALCYGDLPQFSRSQGSSTWACELFTLTLCPPPLTPYTLHALVPAKTQLFVPLPGMPSPTCPSG